jgi:plastocyanin
MRNVFIAIIVILVLAGGYFLVSNRNQPQPAGPGTSSISSQPAPSEEVTGAMMEKKAKETTITLTQSGFDPQTVTIKAGEKVVWVNNSGDVATVNSSKHPTHLDYPPLNLGQFQDGDKLELVFDKPGTYMYHDHLHATRFGKIVVE